MPSTRAKFECYAVEPQYGEAKRVLLRAVYSPDDKGEDGGFTRATPYGELVMNIDNPAAACQFEVGKRYYLDISAAPE